MNLSFRPTPDFKTAAFDLIAPLETPGGQFEPFVHDDDRGVTTMGYGYALLVKVKNTWIIKRSLETDLNLIGFNLSDVDNEVLEQIVEDLNESDTQQARTRIANHQFAPILTQKIHARYFDLEFGRALEGVEDRFKTMASTREDGELLFAEMQGSHELIAITSMTYNSPSTIDPNLVDALITGNRARAWYEMRYNTNSNSIGGQSYRIFGIHNRRVAESAAFGLYDDPDNISVDEAKNVVRFLEFKRPQIVAYLDEMHSLVPGQAVPAPAPKPQLIADVDQQVATVTGVLTTHFVAPLSPGLVIDGEVFIGDEENYGNARQDTHTGTTGNDLMFGELANDQLFGNAGSDVIYGGEGDDELYGDSGDDVLVGGEGSDVISGGDNDDILYGGESDGSNDYSEDILEGGAGFDTYYSFDGDVILDSDGQGEVIHNGQRRHLTADEVAENYYYDKNTGTIIHMTDLDGDGQADDVEVFGSYFQIHDFSSGDLGITLNDAQTQNPTSLKRSRAPRRTTISMPISSRLSAR